MTEVKAKKVTFDTGLPLGTRGTFSHEGQVWIAYPQDKAAALSAVIDKLLGTICLVRDDLVRWMNAHPEDADRVVSIIARTNGARELAREKAQAWTS